MDETIPVKNLFWNLSKAKTREIYALDSLYCKQANNMFRLHMVLFLLYMKTTGFKSDSLRPIFGYVFEYPQW